MLFLELRIENLNSLYGEHRIDFASGLQGASLFLIHGPTGAGKSTLMDAVSLALFGQTPRLPRNRATRDTDDEDSRQVISRGTGHGAAQLTFSKIEEGRRVKYRATWQCQRARRRPDGSLQPPERILERWDEPTERFVALTSDTRVSQYGPHFERVLDGLTASDFKRAVLLAQGDFNAFLKADEGERAAILERLTDTTDYKRIGRRAHAGWQRAQAQLRHAEERLTDVMLLGDEEEAALRAEQQRLASEVQGAEREIVSLRERREWLERRTKLAAELEEAASRHAALEEEWTRQADALARLAEHERCAEAAQLLRDLEQLERLAAELACRLSDERDHERLAESERETARGERDRADARRQGARAAARDAQPEIDRARVLRQSRALAYGERERARQACDRATECALAATTASAEAEQARLTAEQAADRARRQVAALEPARALVEGLPAWRALSLEVGRLEREVAELARAHTVAQSEADELGRALARAVEEARALGETQAASASAELATRTALEQALGTAADPSVRRRALRDEERAALEQRQALSAARALIRARDQALAARASHEEQLARLELSLPAARETRLLAQQALAEAEGVLEKQVALRQTLGFALEMARHRGALVEGQPCPLCGAAEHPYVEDTEHADSDRQIQAQCTEADVAIAAAQRELTAARERAQAATDQLVLLDTRLAVERRSSDALAAGLQQAAGAAARALASLSLPEDASDGELAAMEREAATREEAARAAERELDLAERMWRDAAMALERRRREAVAAHAEARTVQARLQAKRAEAADREAQVRRKQAEVLEREAELLRELAAHVPGSGQERRLDEVLAQLEHRATALREADQALAQARATLHETTSRAAQARDVAEREAVALERAAHEASDREQVLAALEREVASALAGRDPDAVSEALGRDLHEAEEAHARAELRATAAEAQVAAAAASRAGSEAEQARLLSAQGAREAMLRARLSALGLADRTALQARLVDEAVRRELSELRDRLDRERIEREAILHERGEHLVRHDALRPAELGDDESVPALGMRIDALEAAHSAHLGRLGGISQTLARQASARQRLQMLQRELQAARREHALWERLNRLIGVRDGEAFKRFAQILNLEELLAKANHHLARLAPRYRLVPARDADGQPRLAFAVRDAWHADEERPLSTLSGGETFLASLALALALADFHSVRMPIETLLLDEGFGTLDRDTLATAMQALTALQAQGTQVGVISHVEGLRETIPAQIVIKPVGGGRSTVEVRVVGPVP